MSGDREAIVHGLAETAKRYGFRGVRETNYFLERPETVCVVNLQKSNWGPQYYLNAAVWLTRFGVERRPKEYKCQIRWRINSLMDGERSKAFTEALDLNQSMPDDRRMSLIRDGVDSCGFGLLARCENEEASLRLASECGPRIAVLQKVYTQEKGKSNG